MATRREFIKWTAASGVGLAVAGRELLDGPARAAPMAGSVASTLTPYVDQMPLLVGNAINATGGGTVNLTTALISRKVHRDLPATTLFGYLQSPSPPAATDVAANARPSRSPRPATASPTPLAAVHLMNSRRVAMTIPRSDRIVPALYRPGMRRT